MVRGAKAALQITDSFSLTRRAPTQRNPTCTNSNWPPDTVIASSSPMTAGWSRIQSKGNPLSTSSRCSYTRHRRHIADGQATGMNVGSGASISCRPMSAALESVSRQQPPKKLGPLLPADPPEGGYTMTDPQAARLMPVMAHGPVRTDRRSGSRQLTPLTQLTQPSPFSPAPNGSAYAATARFTSSGKSIGIATGIAND